MGLMAWIYLSELGDSSNGGLSSKHRQVIITNFDGPFEPSADTPGVTVMKGHLPMSLRAVPNDQHDRMVMYGGGFVTTSDSRFSEGMYGALEQHWGDHPYCRHFFEPAGKVFLMHMQRVVPLHDRVE